MTSKEELMSIDIGYVDRRDRFGMQNAYNDIVNRIFYKNDKLQNSCGLPEIRKVIFHDPATIIIWSDGSKSIVKCTEKDKYDPEKGFAMAIAKKALGNKGNYYNIFKEYVPVSEDEVDLYYLDNIDL